MSLAPILLFAYKRPDHLTKVINSLLENELSSKSVLIVYSDGPKNSSEIEQVNSVRKVIQSIEGFKEIRLIERSSNVGLSNSIISGVSSSLNEYGRVIVLEDDLVVSRYFLEFMNEGLDFYESKEKVISIHGYVYPVKGILPQNFFLRGADCWGWATWKRGWSLFESDAQELLSQLKRKKLNRKFDMDGAVRNSKMLQDQLDQKIDSWAIRWHASAFLKEKLTLYPGKSLVKNIGTDGQGTHLGNTDLFNTSLSNDKIKIYDIPIKVDIQAENLIRLYYKSVRKSYFFMRLKKLFHHNLK